jgi:thioredoxin reductase
VREGYTRLVSDAYEAVIVGGGAAGLSAALTLGRCCRRVLLYDDGRPRNAVADRMHGFLTRDGTSPAELLRIAREQLAPYTSVGLREAHVDSVRMSGGGFLVSAGGEEIASKAVLLAMGVYDALPAIDGVRERWGKTVFVCPYCDGWEFRGARIGVLGKGRRAAELARELRQWSADLLVCAGEEDLPAEQRGWMERSGVTVRHAELAAVTDRCTLRFSDGTEERCQALFLSAPLRQRYPLVDMLGCRVNDAGEIAVDARGRTGVFGVYAAGDAVTHAHQVVLAAASGVQAAMGVNEDLLL